MTDQDWPGGEPPEDDTTGDVTGPGAPLYSHSPYDPAGDDVPTYEEPPAYDAPAGTTPEPSAEPAAEEGFGAAPFSEDDPFAASAGEGGGESYEYTDGFGAADDPFPPAADVPAGEAGADEGFGDAGDPAAVPAEEPDSAGPAASPGEKPDAAVPGVSPAPGAPSLGDSIDPPPAGADPAAKPSPAVADPAAGPSPAVPDENADPGVEDPAAEPSPEESSPADPDLDAGETVPAEPSAGADDVAEPGAVPPADPPVPDPAAESVPDGDGTGLSAADSGSSAGEDAPAVPDVAASPGVPGAGGGEQVPAEPAATEGFGDAYTGGDPATDPYTGSEPDVDDAPAVPDDAAAPADSPSGTGGPAFPGSGVDEPSTPEDSAAPAEQELPTGGESTFPEGSAVPGFADSGEPAFPADFAVVPEDGGEEPVGGLGDPAFADDSASADPAFPADPSAPDAGPDSGADDLAAEAESVDVWPGAAGSEFTDPSGAPGVADQGSDVPSDDFDLEDAPLTEEDFGAAPPVGVDPDVADHGAGAHWDIFPPELGLELPEAVDGPPWIDPDLLGDLSAGDLAEGLAPADLSSWTDPVAAPESTIPAPDLFAYAGEADAGGDPWAALQSSEDPATAALARWWAPPA